MTFPTVLKDREYAKFVSVGVNGSVAMLTQSVDIKSVTLTNTFTAETSGIAAFSSVPINGEILQVEKSAFWQGGSLALVPSGLTGQEVWRVNASSGAATTISYPAHFNQSTTGSIAGASNVPFIINDVLKLTTGSTASGASQTLSVVVKYR